MDGELDERSAAATAINGCARAARRARYLAHLPPDQRRDARHARAVGRLLGARGRSASRPSRPCSRQGASRASQSRTLVRAVRGGRASRQWRWWAGWRSRRSGGAPQAAQAPGSRLQAAPDRLVPPPSAGQRLSARPPGFSPRVSFAGHGALRAHRLRRRRERRRSDADARALRLSCSCLAPALAQAQTPEALALAAQDPRCDAEAFLQRHLRLPAAATAARPRASRACVDAGGDIEKARGAGRRAARDRAHARHGALLPARQPRGEGRARAPARARLSGAAARAASRRSRATTTSALGETRAHRRLRLPTR